MPHPLGGYSLVQGVLCGEWSPALFQLIPYTHGWLTLYRVILGYCIVLTLSRPWSVNILLGANLSAHHGMSLWLKFGRVGGGGKGHPEFQLGAETYPKSRGSGRADPGSGLFLIRRPGVWMCIIL